MELLELLEQLEETLERGMNIPFSGRCVVRRDEVLELIQDIRLKLPDDIKTARNISVDKAHILEEAEGQASEILRNAETRITALVDEHEITRKAVEQAGVIIGNAKKNSREIRLGTREYADGVLDKVESILSETLEVIRVNRQELK
jgi:vacuolar-type H+-ATPase subunit H